MQCSIDGLLDRTVKHMLFFERVGDRAIKLRQCLQSEARDFRIFLSIFSCLYITSYVGGQNRMHDFLIKICIGRNVHFEFISYSNKLSSVSIEVVVATHLLMNGSIWGIFNL